MSLWNSPRPAWGGPWDGMTLPGIFSHDDERPVMGADGRIVGRYALDFVPVAARVAMCRSDGGYAWRYRDARDTSA